MIDLYKNIKNRRLEMDMSQQTLAEKVGYSGKSMISKVERGEVDLSTTMINKFADALNTTPSDLMGWNDIEWDPETQEIFDSNKNNNDYGQYQYFLNTNPEYKVLFDASAKVNPKNIEKALKALELFID